MDILHLKSTYFSFTSSDIFVSKVWIFNKISYVVDITKLLEQEKEIEILDLKKFWSTADLYI